jgi:hypothetical protein
VKNFLTIIAVAALLGAAFNASAENDTRPPPTGFPGKPNVIEVPAPQGPDNLTSNADSQSRSDADARAAANADANAKAESYNALNISDHSKFITFGAPAWTNVPSAHNCTHSDAMAWSATLASYSRTKQYTGPVCAMLQLADKAEASCQYQTANLLKREAMAQMNPGMEDDVLNIIFPARVNLTPIECSELLRPRLILDGRVSAPAPVAAAPAAPVSVDVDVQCAPRGTGGTVTPRPKAPAKPVEKCVPAMRTTGGLL